MKRGEFLKKLAVGAGVAVVTPTVLMAKKSKPDEKPLFAVDVLSISNITEGGKRITPAEILNLYHQTGILIYKSRDGKGNSCDPPTIIRGKIEVVDVSKLK